MYSFPPYRYPFTSQLARYRAPGITRAFADFLVLNAVAANYDGLGFTIRSVQQVRAGLPGTDFQFFVSPTPPPVLPVIGIDLTGAPATTLAIASSLWQGILQAPEFAPRSPHSGSPLVRVYQTIPGSRGNTQVLFDNGLGALITVNGFNPFSEVANFYLGRDATPIRWGLSRGVMPGPNNDVPGVTGG
jgi:hypothetical protein